MKQPTDSSILKNGLFWLLCVVGLLVMSTPALAYKSSQKQTITRTAQLSTFNFTNLPASAGNVTVKVSVYGDFEASNEYADVFIDGRSQARITGETTTCNTTVTANRGTRTYTLPASNVSDGRLLIYVRNSRSVGTSCTRKEVVVEVSYTNAPQSELTITAVKVPTSGSNLSANATFQGQYTIKNTGVDLTTNFLVRYYSCPAASTSNCTYLGYQTISQNIKKGASHTYTSVNLRLPSNTRTGTRYIRAYVDATNAVSESNETNNNAYSKVTIVAPAPDLAVTVLTVTPTSAYPGARLIVRYQFRNLGSQTASFLTRLYWSTDATITTADTYLNQQNTITLGAGQTSGTYTASITIAATQKLGTYYIGAFADYNNSVRELSETNNTRSVKVTVSSEKADLQFTSSNVPTSGGSLAAGATFTGRYSVRNNGGATKIDFTVQYFYCTTTGSTGCTSLGKQTITKDLNKGENYYFTSISLKLPTNAATGTRYIRAIVDADKKVVETNENNNVDVDSISVTPARPDLVVESLSIAPTAAKQGGKVVVTYKVKNNGTATARNFRIRLYYSDNNYITTRDVYLNAQQTITSLAAGASSAAFKSTITVPGNASLGTRYIGAIVDDSATVRELNENNNTRFATLTVRGTPDLSVRYLVVSPTTAGPGSNMTVTFQLYNGGTDTASNFKVRLYYSTDATITTADTYLNIERTVSSLRSRGSSGYYRVTVAVPTAATPGVRYIGAIVDYDKKVAESNENNNTRAAAFRIPSAPDLLVDILTLNPTSSQAGGKVTVTYRVANRGTAAARSFVVNLYYSYRSDLGGGRSLNVSKTVTSLAAGKTTQTYTATITIPSNIPSGATLYIGAWADPNRRVSEINENNNVKSAPLSVISSKPDLVFTSSTVPSSGSVVSAGGSFTGRYTIKNNGPKITKDFVVRYQQCRTTSLATCSTASLGTQTITKDLGPGESFTFTSVTLKLPANTPTTTIYILATVDSTNVIAEQNETNNRDLDAISVRRAQADLQVEVLTATPLTSSPGGTVSVSYRLFNAGGADAANSTFRLYLSSNTTISTSDTYLGHQRVLALKANARSQTYTVQVKIPTNQRLGTWFLGGLADVARVIAETNENNNFRYVRITLGQGKPDLVADSVAGAKAQYRTNEIVTLVYKVTNKGSATVTKMPIFFYMSTDATITGADTPVGSTTIASISPNQTFTGSITVRIPPSAKAGVNYFGSFVDPGNILKESNESNNTASGKLLILTDADKDGFWYAPGCPASVKDCDCKDNDKTIHPKAKELCDSKDNNCDGKVDEGCKCKDGDTQACGSDVGACKKGKQTCKNGVWGACVGETKATKELCDGKDNDCDGKVDEDFADKGKACSVGNGACKTNGKYICKTDGSGIVCDAKVIKPSKEICDGKDNDCDGQTDEDFSDLGKACTLGKGICKSSGKNICKTDGSGITCDAKVIQPGKEICDNKDNDCDGQTDEDGVCQEPNTEPNTEPTPDGGTEPTPDAGSEPTPDTAPDASPDVTPDVGDCYTTGCPTGKVCKDGKCEDDPCLNITCKNDEFCRDGQCVQACGCKQCAAGEYCVDGVCEKDACVGVACAADEICDKTTGQCEPDQCKNVTCASGRVCEANSGTCVDDPCNFITCPNSLVCKAGQCVGVQCSTEPNTEPGTEPGTEPSTDASEPSQEVVTDEPGTTPDDGGTTDEPVADKGTEPGAEPNTEPSKETTPDSASTDKNTGGKSDKDLQDIPTPAGGCECSTNGNSSAPFFFLFLLFFLPVLRRRHR
jgi:MYXO-CTERM domain-containing protein